jgi:hypothetical protein
VSDTWRYTDEADSGHIEGNLQATWINVDTPYLGSMHIRHDCDTDLPEAQRRTRIMALAPGLLDFARWVAELIEGRGPK